MVAKNKKRNKSNNINDIVTTTNIFAPFSLRYFNCDIASAEKCGITMRKFRYAIIDIVLLVVIVILMTISSDAAAATTRDGKE